LQSPDEKEGNAGLSVRCPLMNCLQVQDGC